jgi:hypothetical protein
MHRAAGPVIKLLAMPARDRRLLARALCLVVGFRVALRVMDWSRIRALAARSEGRSAVLAKLPPVRLAWAVRAAARSVPGATCLTQSLALRHLLAKAGHAAEIRIGVARSEHGGLDSHAWVVCHGRVLVGDTGDLERYQPIMAMGMRQR